MKVFLDRLNIKKQLPDASVKQFCKSRLVLQQINPTYGSKVDLEIFQQQCFVSEGVSNSEFYVEMQAKEIVSAEQVSFFKQT